jgi:hypothetical protein
MSVGWGIVMIGLSYWSLQQSLEAMSKVIEDFYDTPMIAMPLMSSFTVTIANSRINLLIGVAFIAFGVVRFFIPDFKTVVLLDVANSLGVGSTSEEDKNDETK